MPWTLNVPRQRLSFKEKQGFGNEAEREQERLGNESRSRVELNVPFDVHNVGKCTGRRVELIATVLVLRHNGVIGGAMLGLGQSIDELPRQAAWNCDFLRQKLDAGSSGME